MGVHKPGPVDVLVAGFLLLAIAAAVIIARVYLRLSIQKRHLIVSDVLMCTAWVAGCVQTCFGIVLMNLGGLDPHALSDMSGFHTDPKKISELFKMLWMFNIPFFSTLYLCKAALLSMYLPIFPIFMGKRRIFLWMTIVFVFLSYLITMVLLFCICTPIESVWDLEPRSCPDSRKLIFFVLTWALHLFGDLLVFVLPWLVLHGINNMTQNLKAGLYVTFLLGIITIVISIVRYTSLSGRKSTVTSVSTIALWTTLEANLGIVIACLPSLRPYFGRTEQSVKKSSTTEQSSEEPKAGFVLISPCSNSRNTTNQPISHAMENQSDVELAQGIFGGGGFHDGSIESTSRQSEGTQTRDDAS
ncbi:hypothetical protein B0J13DRAFT_149012 [Dactylonectria estremocensis]|uniref:Rhodopsin domain-containing protein n=1 Tax=Dactylonectria estremocensis TaxID=1079267 RepID=A0A9P9DW65_9HYPO|nr:hypothetical protein B0J13DRAFT_149012 [Dactylonectria estremocensis]